MEKNKREQAIVEILEEKGFASIQELSRLLFTSASSIRRDLAKLEEAKAIKKTHGGAILTYDKKIFSPFHARKAIHTEQKKAAVQKAAFLIQDHMSVMLDGSTTALHVLPHLKNHKGIRVFTNGVYTYQQALKMGLEAYCLGGGASADSEILSGSITESAVERLHTDLLFFSSKCINENGDITDPIDCETRLRKIMLAHARMRVFLYDSGKMGSTALFRLCNVSEVEYSFSDIS